MAAPLAAELERLLNPLPRAQPDPEDDPEEATAAKVIDKFDEGNLDEDVLSVGQIRKGIASQLLDADKRYQGKATSRKALEEELWGSAEVSDEETSGEETDGGDLDSEILAEDESPESEEEEGEAASVAEEEKKLSNKVKKPAFSFQAIDDFEKFAERMDELGSEEEEEASSGEDQQGGSDSQESAKESEEEMEVADRDPEVGILLTHSQGKAAEEVAKGKAVKNQIALWDQLLESRIKLQKALLIANQIPQPDTFSEFKKRGGQEFSNVLKNSYKALKALLRSLVDLQNELWHQNSGTRHLVAGQEKEESDEEISSGSDEAEEGKRVVRRPPKRKLEMEDYPEFASKRFAEFRVYRNSTLQKWHDKTKLASGKLGKGFGAFERSILTQVDHILMDKERLLRRTQTKRSAYRVLGKTPPVAEVLPETELAEMETVPPVMSNAHLKDLDVEIFDDDDFYHQEADGARMLSAPTAASAHLHLSNRERGKVPDANIWQLNTETGLTLGCPAISKYGAVGASVIYLDLAAGCDSLAAPRISQLLRELIERKTSSLDPNDQVAMGRQWLAIQKLRSKIRKRVDTKASKGRKIRYHVHSKLASFMAPIDHCTMNDDARTELYRSLFGKQVHLQEGGQA